MDKPEPRHIYAEKLIRQTISQLKVDDRIPGERVFAKELGISYMTVRRAVENLVAKGLLYKVAKKGTYVANPKDATKTKNIGYFLDSSIKEGVSSPYYSMIFSALEKQAAKNGYALIYFSNNGQSVPLNIINKLDGVIISCFPRIEPLVQEMKRHLPVVCIDNSSPDKSIPSLTIDNYNSVVHAINYLCSLGHERIGFITGLDDSDVGRNRLAGYASALKSNDIDDDKALVFRGDYSFETGTKGADYFLSLEPPPTAIMCANDIMAISVIKEINQRGFDVPDDISIIGFDDIVIASRITPSLTTISVPVEEIAQQSINLLKSAMYDDDLKNRHATLPCQLTVRDSCTERSTSTFAAEKTVGGQTG